MLRIYCKNKKDWIKYQKILLKQGYRWRDTGNKIFLEKNGAIVLNVNQKNKILTYTDIFRLSEKEVKEIKKNDIFTIMSFIDNVFEEIYKKITK